MFTQYVILGAGLDSFAWRRPGALTRLTVYEIDHPATQAWKRQRAEVVALPRSDRHAFAPIDFETQTLGEGLQAARIDWAAPTLFAWLGVAPYLTADAITATLETIATAGPGSELVLTYATSGPPAGRHEPPLHRSAERRSRAVRRTARNVLVTRRSRTAHHELRPRGRRPPRRPDAHGALFRRTRRRPATTNRRATPDNRRCPHSLTPRPHPRPMNPGRPALADAARSAN